jgi:hypothetical protein
MLLSLLGSMWIPWLAAAPLSAGTCCDGDLNDNGQINVVDLGILVACLASPNPNPACDVNCDGEINYCDLHYFNCLVAGGGEACCQSGCGACCIDGLWCSETSGAQCAAAGGVFQGEGTLCGEVNASLITEPGGQVFTHKVGPPAECPQDPAPLRQSVVCPPGGILLDPWISELSGTSCHNFGVPGSPPIPADFFAPGSAPFTGQVCFTGVPSGHPDFPDADTIIRRIGTDIDRCSLTAAPTFQVEIIELNLASIAPITVVVTGQPETWDVAVDLSSVPAPLGFLSGSRTHCNGGTYFSSLQVRPRFTFTKVSDPGQVRVLDTGLAGIPPVSLAPAANQEWAIDVPAGIAGANYCTSFHPGFFNRDTAPCDCNSNNVRDVCDIESGTSLDVNSNGTPDECELGLAVPNVEQYEIPLTLGPAVPNPMQASTSMAFTLARGQNVTVTIHDVRGRTVRTLVNEFRPLGIHVVTWDGKDDEGTLVPPSIYYGKLVSEDGTRTTRVAVVR